MKNLAQEASVGRYDRLGRVGYRVMLEVGRLLVLSHQRDR